MACDDLLLVFMYPICRFMELKQLSRISFVETVLENRLAANRLNSGLLQSNSHFKPCCKIFLGSCSLCHATSNKHVRRRGSFSALTIDFAMCNKCLHEDFLSDSFGDRYSAIACGNVQKNAHETTELQTQVERQIWKAVPSELSQRGQHYCHP